MTMLNPAILVPIRPIKNNLICFTTVLLIILLSYGVNPSVGCDNGLFSLNIGTTTRDLTLREGDPMEINCTLSASRVTLPNGKQVDANSNMLLMKANGARLTNSKIRIVDDLTIQYRVKRTTMKENGLHMCYFDPGIVDLKPIAVCGTYVKIAHVPNANYNFNFRCTGYDLKNFTCTWDPKDYNIQTVYDLHMLIGANHSYSACSAVKNSCTFSTKDQAPYLISDKRIRFRLEISNKLGSAYKIYEVDHYSNVVLSPITKIIFQSVGMQDAYITWDPPKSIMFDDYLESIAEYEIKVTPSLSDKTTDEPSSIQKYPQNTSQQFRLKANSFLNVSNLIPFTRYTFDIRSRMNTDDGEGQWSEIFEDYATTKPDVPYYYPTFPLGGFEELLTTSDQRTIIVYFNPMESIYKNGPNLTYLLKINSVQQESEMSALKSVIPDQSFSQSQSYKVNSSTPLSFDKPNSSLSDDLFSATLPITSMSNSNSSAFYQFIMNTDTFSWEIENLNVSNDYKLEILSLNELGYSTGSSFISIPRMNYVLPVLDQVYAINWGNGSFTLYWSASSTDLIDSYIVYWCEIAEGPACDSPLQNTQVSKDLTSLNLTLPSSQYKLGVAALGISNRLSKGIKWSSCIETAMYLTVKNRFKHFDLISIGSNSIKVVWELDCPALYHFVNLYQIHYCPADRPCSESLTVVDVNPNSFEYNVDNLESSTKYNFTVHAITIRGQELESPIQTIETKLDSVSLIVTILIILTGIILILSIVYSLFVFSMRKRKDKKELKKAVDSNWIPKMPSRLKGDANILLNPLCQETRNEYENKEYMNADATNTTKFIAKGLNSRLRLDETLMNNCKNAIILSTISGNQLNDVINKRSPSSLPSSSSSSSSTASADPDEGLGLSLSKCSKQDGLSSQNFLTKKERKSSDGCGCDSEDSGYSARHSDRHPYYRAASFNISGIIRSIDEDSPYIVPDKSTGIPIQKLSNNNSSMVARSLSDSDLSYDHTVITMDSPSLQSNGYIPVLHHEIDHKDVQTISNGYVYA